MHPKKIYVIAGEASGDLHGAKLIDRLRKQSPSPVEIYGIGGDKIKASGALHFMDLAHFHATGFTDAVKKIPLYKKAFSRIIQDVQNVNPALVVLIDNPGFNFRLAEKIHAMGIPIVYYIAPQLWAWGQKRIFKMKKFAKKVLVVFDFEKKLYEDHGIPVSFVGHPLRDWMDQTPHRRNTPGREKQSTMITLLPGSRTGELKMLLTPFLDAAKIIRQTLPAASFQIIQAPTLPWDRYEREISKRGLPVRVVDKNSYDAIAQSDLAIVCSGTATLECAILKTPMIICYKGSYLTYRLARSLVKVRYIGMPNLILDKAAFPELLQYDTSAEKIAKTALDLLASPERMSQMINDLAEVSQRLGPQGASSRAADEILKMLSQCIH